MAKRKATKQKKTDASYVPLYATGRTAAAPRFGSVTKPADVASGVFLADAPGAVVGISSLHLLITHDAPAGLRHAESIFRAWIAEHGHLMPEDDQIIGSYLYNMHCLDWRDVLDRLDFMAWTQKHYCALNGIDPYAGSAPCTPLPSTMRQLLTLRSEPGEQQTL